jgi:GWxTD domain-containing protein
MRRTGILLLTLFLAAHPGSAQPTERPGIAGPGPRSLYIEAINLPANDSTLSRIDIHYRCDREFFVPVKNTTDSFHWDFKRSGEITVELLDSTGLSKARDLDHVEIGEATSERRFETRAWHTGIFSFEVPPGKYTALCEVSDLESKRNFFDRNTTVTAARFGSDSLQLSTPFFTSSDSGGVLADRLVPQAFGGDVEFSAPGGVFFVLTSTGQPEAPVEVRYSIAVVPPPDKGPPQHPDSLVTLHPEAGISLRPVNEPDSVCYHLVHSPGRRSSAFLVPMPTASLPLRHFKLTMTITQGRAVRTVTKPFQVVWPDMPFSLKDVDMALDVLRYITTENQLDSLKHGSWETRRDNLEGFWREKGQTSATMYNKAMTQYYRRVDYAIRTFGTLRQPDGFRSDRGRIFILYGPASTTERSLDPSAGFKEVWVYSRLKKKFVFVDENKSGNYILVSAAEL